MAAAHLEEAYLSSSSTPFVSAQSSPIPMLSLYHSSAPSSPWCHRFLLQHHSLDNEAVLGEDKVVPQAEEEESWLWCHASVSVPFNWESKPGMPKKECEFQFGASYVESAAPLPSLSLHSHSQRFIPLRLPPGLLRHSRRCNDDRSPSLRNLSAAQFPRSLAKAVLWHAVCGGNPTTSPDPFCAAMEELSRKNGPHHQSSPPICGARCTVPSCEAGTAQIPRNDDHNDHDQELLARSRRYGTTKSWIYKYLLHKKTSILVSAGYSKGPCCKESSKGSRSSRGSLCSYLSQADDTALVCMLTSPSSAASPNETDPAGMASQYECVSRCSDISVTKSSSGICSGYGLLSCLGFSSKQTIGSTMVTTSKAMQPVR